jgi:hypothetical protein
VAAKIVIPEALRDAAKQAKRDNWEITRTGGHHLRWKSPSGAVVFLSATPRGGRHSIENSRALLRRAGLSI